MLMLLLPLLVAWDSGVVRFERYKECEEIAEIEEIEKSEESYECVFGQWDLGWRVYCGI